MEAIFSEQTVDELLGDLSVLKELAEIKNRVDAYLAGDYENVLSGAQAQDLFKQFLNRLSDQKESGDHAKSWTSKENDSLGSAQALLTGLASFNAFLQANVTGPPLSRDSLLFGSVVEPREVEERRKQCVSNLTIDGLSVYQYIPHVELFTFARAIFTEYFPRVVSGKILDSKWMRIRINAYHQRLLSSGMSNTRLTDSVASLQTQVEVDLISLEKEILAENSAFSTEAKVQFVLEKAQIFIMHGLEVKAKENVQQAKAVSQFSYALSGALGKKTKFQQKDTSQLVVFAKSHEDSKVAAKSSALSPRSQIAVDLPIHNKVELGGPSAVELNDDTLLESIHFTKAEKDEKSDLPSDLADLQPDKQPQLKPLDQIILLTEATLKDAFLPQDKLNSEEVLPFAVRVLNDKPTNWQIYTQALLVRSRIESHRSRTMERSVLQLQAIVDQIIAEIEKYISGGDGIPQIHVTQFLPSPKESESAPVTERLKYIHQLNTPTRWEIETELAYAWSKAGSLVSAMEIFKRLKLWAEVALCYHSVGQEDKALQVIRRQLYYSSKGPEMDKYSVDAEEVIAEKWRGEIRTPPPPHAPRLWCILGDLEQDPSCWESAWEISNKHYARAQRTLGEYYIRQDELEKARDAYLKATVVNRQNGETWSRLGDIDLKVGNWDGAIIAYQQAIMIDDDDAKTYSNLGSALLSKHTEMTQLQKPGTSERPKDSAVTEVLDDEEPGTQTQGSSDVQQNIKEILRQSLIAYRRGASLAYDNWQIWDNVITIAGRMSPPSFPEILMGMKAVIRIRSPTSGENAVDIDILRALVGEVLASEKDENPITMEGGIYTPPRGSLPRAVIDMVDSDVIPLITQRSELWALVEKLQLYRKDYQGALACAEKRWRIATAGDAWLEDNELWTIVADATDGLVSAFENYGPQEKSSGSGVVEKGWKMKARSAVRSILGKVKDVWGETEEYSMLEQRLEELKNM
jgi:tetratricopeptide (TPR) repeat protein